MAKGRDDMKPEGHPLYPPAKITCACGNVIESRSTRGSFSVEICAACHPFFTGKYKLVDTAGRVDRFRKKYETAAAQEKKAAADKKKAGKKTEAKA